MIEIDGSMGEGGGQIVRTALALSVLRTQPVRLSQIRAGRDSAGLRPQHKTAVEAAAAIEDATVSGASVGSTTLTFAPSGICPGTHHFDVGSAGSAVLVLQTVLPQLLTAQRASRVTVVGGTHVRSAPPFEHLAKTFLPLLNQLGPVCRADLDQPGFYPRGGGRCSVEMTPVAPSIPSASCTGGKSNDGGPASCWPICPGTSPSGSSRRSASTFPAGWTRRSQKPLSRRGPEMPS